MSQRLWRLMMVGIVAVLAVLALQQAGQAPDVAFDSLGSAAVPTFVAVTLLLLAGLMLMEALIAGKKSHQRSLEDLAETAADELKLAQPDSAGLRAGAGFLVFIVYVSVLALTQIYFWLATMVFIYLSSRILAGRSKRDWHLSLLLAVVISTSVELIFSRLLLIDLP